MGASSGPRLSGMQKQVLSIYRGFLRAARAKSAEDRQQIESLVSIEFRRNAKEVDRKNFLYIEYLLRRAKKQLDQLRSPDIVGLSALNRDGKGNSSRRANMASAATNSIVGVRDKVDEIKQELISMKSFLKDAEGKKPQTEGEETWVAS